MKLPSGASRYLRCRQEPNNQPYHKLPSSKVITHNIEGAIDDKTSKASIVTHCQNKTRQREIRAIEQMIIMRPNNMVTSLKPRQIINILSIILTNNDRNDKIIFELKNTTNTNAVALTINSIMGELERNFQPLQNITTRISRPLQHHRPNQ